MSRFILNETSYHGKGVRAEIATEVKKKGLKKALLISDKILVKIGVVAKVEAVLNNAGIAYEVFDDIKPNPTMKNCYDCLTALNNAKADFVIAVGGGSVIDTAKCAAIIKTNPDFADIRKLEGVAETKNKCLPIFAIATTCGTAAEVTINYVITDDENNRKLVCVDPNDIPVVAIVDSELMESMPKSLIAATGMDALTHAIECYTTKGATKLSDMFAIKSIELIANNLKKAVDGDKDALENMALAQYIAGMGFSNVGLGVVHGMAHPMGAIFDVPHGVANALLLPYVMEYNMSTCEDKFRVIAKTMKGCNCELSTIQPQDAIEEVRKLSKSISIPEKLHELNIKESDLERLSKDAIKDPCTGGNPKDITVDGILKIYKTAY